MPAPVTGQLPKLPYYWQKDVALVELVRTARGRIGLSTILAVCLLVVVAFMVLYPVIMVFFGSLRNSAPGSSGQFTLDGYSKVYSNPDTLRVLWTTFWLAVTRTILAVSIAIYLAWIVARTDIPHKLFLEVALLFTFFAPLLPKILGWTLLLSPRSGLVNVFLRAILPFDIPGLNIYSYGGIIWVGVLTWVPILYVFIAPAFKAMDATLEDSARMSGASRLVTVARINLPLLAPAILATMTLGFVHLMESFTVEAMLGWRVDIRVLSSRVYQYIAYSYPPEYGPGMALAATMLVITVGMVVLQWRLLGQRKFVTVTGKAFRARPIELGQWRWVAFVSILLFVIVSTAVPMAVLLWGSFTRVAGVFMQDMYTLDHYRSAFSNPKLWTAVKNTLVMGTSTATIGMVLCALISYVVVKTKFFGRRALDLVAWVPWAVPGIVMSLGFLWAYLLLPLPFRMYGTLTLIILCLITKGLPLGTRSITSTVVQISDELEEAGRVHGASWVQNFVRILFPLFSRGFLAGWILLFASAVKDLETVIMLYVADSAVMSTQIFEWWSSGNMEEAVILGLLEAALIAICFIGSKVIGARIVGQESAS